MWKNRVEPEDHRLQYNTTQKRCDLHAGWLRQEYRHTLIIFITYCFSTATMVTRTRLNVMLCVHCLPCSLITPLCLWAIILYPILADEMQFSYVCYMNNLTWDSSVKSKIPKTKIQTWACKFFFLFWSLIIERYEQNNVCRKFRTFNLFCDTHIIDCNMSVSFVGNFRTFFVMYSRC